MNRNFVVRNHREHALLSQDSLQEHDQAFSLIVTLFPIERNNQLLSRWLALISSFCLLFFVSDKVPQSVVPMPFSHNRRILETTWSRITCIVLKSSAEPSTGAVRMQEESRRDGACRGYTLALTTNCGGFAILFGSIFSSLSSFISSWFFFQPRTKVGCKFVYFIPVQKVSVVATQTYNEWNSCKNRFLKSL